MIRWSALLAFAVAAPAYADVDLRYSLGAAVGMRAGPNGYGAAAAVDAATHVSPSILFVGHFGLAMLWAPEGVSPSERGARLVLPQLHAMLEYRDGPMSYAAGLGLDAFTANYNGGGEGTRIVGFGVNLRVGVDLVRDEHGVFGVVADATVSPVGGFAFGDWWDRDHAVTTMTLGCAFRPR